LRDFIEDGRDHFARATPLCPKINQHRQTGLFDIGFEGGVRYGFDEGAAHGIGLVGECGEKNAQHQGRESLEWIGYSGVESFVCKISFLL
jgi:hypothetical protein